MDILHEIMDEFDLGYSEANLKWQREGCEAIGAQHGDMGTWGSNAAMVASLAYEIMGDDVDGIASMMEDAELFGIL
jgi:hypothetical protein